MSEQPYTPDTETVREQYTREQPPHIGTVSSKSAEFERWLDRIKADARREGQADAWDEGWNNRAGYDATPDADEPESCNPYRKGN